MRYNVVNSFLSSVRTCQTEPDVGQTTASAQSIKAITTYVRSNLNLPDIYIPATLLCIYVCVYIYKVRSFELTSGKIVKKKREEKRREMGLLSFSPATMIILRIPDISLIDFFYCPVRSTSNFVLAGRRSQSYLKLLRASRTTATTS